MVLPNNNFLALLGAEHNLIPQINCQNSTVNIRPKILYLYTWILFIALQAKVKHLEIGNLHVVNSEITMVQLLYKIVTSIYNNGWIPFSFTSHQLVQFKLIGRVKLIFRLVFLSTNYYVGFRDVLMTSLFCNIDLSLV